VLAIEGDVDVDIYSTALVLNYKNRIGATWEIRFYAFLTSKN
jgi:hypothetical protein